MASLTPAPRAVARARLHSAVPRIEREGIRFHNLSFERVRIELELTNESELSCAPMPVRIDAAPFGAFLPWRPLAWAVSPALEPGESGRIVLEARRPQVLPIASSSNLPPRNLAAVAAAAGEANDRDGSVRSDGDDLTRTFRRRRAAIEERLLLRTGRDLGLLPADLFELLGHANPHWAGNLNVFIGPHPVERHRAPALRVYPGELNFAIFCLGEGRDAYSFELRGSATAWQVHLRRTRNWQRGGGPELARAPQIRTGQWVETRREALIGISIVPPEWAEAGALEVHVRQRSSGHEAVVEFDLDPRAEGPGCFTL